MSPSLETSFDRLLGRQATEEERRRLYEIRDALGLAENDALWLVLIALEHYDALYREYPARIAAETRKTLADLQGTFARAVDVEAKRAHRRLAEAVAQAGTAIATKRTDAARLQGAAVAAAAAVIFGGLCVLAGTSIASGRAPVWAHGDGKNRIVTAVLGAPVGWTAFVLLLPVSAQWARTGWLLARDRGAPVRTRAKGWVVLAGAVLGAAICVAALLRIV
jgi:hypothetical protein